MMNIGNGLRKMRHASSAACLVLAMACSYAGAAEVPLVDGTHWVKSTAEVKKAYLVGAANIIQLEVAYRADNPAPDNESLAPRFAEGLKGQTLITVLENLDKWYAAHPEQLQRPVIETIWFELVVPALKTNK